MCTFSARKLGLFHYAAQTSISNMQQRMTMKYSKLILAVALFPPNKLIASKLLFDSVDIDEFIMANQRTANLKFIL